MTDWSDRRRGAPLAVAVVCLLSLFAAACGGSSSSDGDNTEGTVPPRGADVVLTSDGPPQTGGTLTYGLEAESDGFDPTSNRFAASGTEVGLALYDPLAAFDVDNTPQPYLAESMTPSADNLTWTIKARPDITFHNGETLDGEALRIFFEGLRADALVGIAFVNIAAVAVDPSDPLAVVLTMDQPWATFPVFLTGQGGMVTAPAMADDPESGRNPIGTGPFKLDQWVPDNSLSASKNADYWRTDDNGVQLPYLDGVEFKPLPDRTTRSASLESGDVDMIHNVDVQVTKKFTDQAASGQVQIIYDRGEREEEFFMLNTSVAPLDDLRVRQALAYATDPAQFNAVIYDGEAEIGDGIFSQDSAWRGDGAPYPEYNPEMAMALVEEYEAEVGPIQFTLENSGTDDRAIALAKEQWAAVGIDVEISLVEQSQFILNAVTGDYQAHDWRQFGALDPDYDYIWWIGENGTGGGISLNFARNKNPEIDAALNEARATTDPETRQAAYLEVQRLINEDLPYIWYARTQWVIVANNSVRGITNGALPDGQESNPLGGPGGFGGVTRLTQTWKVA